MRFSDQTFTDQNVDLDFNHFERCAFLRCRLVYRGAGFINLHTCTFTDISFRFDDAASRTVETLTLMYHSGLRPTVEDLLRNLVRGVYPRAPEQQE